MDLDANSLRHESGRSHAATSMSGPLFSLFLTRLVSLFVYPLGAALLVAATAFALSFTSFHHIGQVLLGIALGILWVAATPGFAKWLNWRLVSRFPHVYIDDLPQSDAVILL